MRESKSDCFCRVAEARVNKIIKMVRLLGNCSGIAYEHTPGQVQQIFGTLQTELDRAKKRYTIPVKKRFSLSDSSKAESPKYPEIHLPLPDGTYLKAVAIADETYPSINIYLNCGTENSEELVCFAEYNPERSPCYKVCIGTYQSDKNDTTYYEPYMAERDLDEHKERKSTEA